MSSKSTKKQSGGEFIVVKAVVDIGGVGQVSNLSPRLNGEHKVQIRAGTHGILLPREHSSADQEVMFDYGKTGVASMKVGPGDIAQI